MAWTRGGRIAVAFTFAIVAAEAKAFDETYPALRFISPALNGQPASIVRSLTRCAAIGRNLPFEWGWPLDEAVEFNSIELDVKLERGGPVPSRLFLNDAGQATVFTLTETEIRLVGMSFDIDLALDALTYRSPDPQNDVLRVRMSLEAANEPPMTAEALVYITGNTGNAINVVPCHAPPALLPADDTGLRADDDYTRVPMPGFSVASASPQVEWYRNDVLVATTPVVAGFATYVDDGTLPAGERAYHVRHGTGPRSAARYVYVDPLPDGVFANGFE